MRQQFRWGYVMMALATTCAACSPAMAFDDVYLFDLIKQPAYARSLKTLFDRASSLPSWAREALKPKGYMTEAPQAYVTIDGTSYETFFECEPQNCNVNQM